jgi:DNA-binding MarR family transcriptional regulator
MTDETPPPRPEPSDDPDDVNEAVVAEWVEETTPFERVFAVIRRTYDPASADRVAERARVSPTTARKHLRTLVDTGEVTTAQDGQTTVYRRSETAVVTERVQSIREELTREEIATGIADMKTTIRDWRETYGVESPEALARELDVTDADEDHAAVVREWQTTRRNLAIAEAALAVEEASGAGHFDDERRGDHAGEDGDERRDDGDASLVA